MIGGQNPGTGGGTGVIVLYFELQNSVFVNLGAKLHLLLLNHTLILFTRRVFVSVELINLPIQYSHNLND